MAKYHVNDSGNVGKCTASKNTCRFGGDAGHFDNKLDARAAYEKSMASEDFKPYAQLSYDERKLNLASAFNEELPGLKLVSRYRTNDQLVMDLALRKDQEVLFKVQGKSTYDPDFNRTAIKKWAEDNSLRVVFNYGNLNPPTGPEFAHLIINKPRPTDAERLQAKKDQMKKLQDEIKQLEKE